MSTPPSSTPSCPGGQQSQRPLILLDVDYVVNRFPPLETLPRRDDEFEDLRETRASGFPITYSPEMGRRLAALEGDIYWLTTWEAGGLANAEIAPIFGWDPLPTIARADHDEKAGWDGWWKSSAAQEIVTQHRRPFVWLDDELQAARKHGQIAWLRRCDVPHLLISPELGLLPRHLDEIETWIRSLGVDNLTSTPRRTR
ncbi:MAG: HAD domain-containing protein [Acidimicrobiales bacterium]